MKKIFYLLTIACMLVACEDSNKTGKGTEPTGLSVPAEGTAGAKITVVGQDIAKDAEFYLSNTDSKTELAAEILASGAEVTLPYTLGEFTLSLEQDGASYNVGTIKVAVTGIVMPEEAAAGEEMTITANGFADDAAIFFGSEEAAAVFTAAGCTATVPATAGEVTVTVKQKGTEQELGTIVVTEGRKVVTSFKMEAWGSELEFRMVYSGNTPQSFSYDETSYTVSSEGNVYTFSDGTFNWAFTVENNRVEKIKIDGGEEHEWKYNDGGYLISYWTDNKYPIDESEAISYDEAGNFGIDFGYEYSDPSLVNKSDAMDFAKAFALIMMSGADNEQIYAAAAMLGWAGKASPNLATGLMGMGCTFELDNEGYATKFSTEDGSSVLSCTYNR